MKYTLWFSLFALIFIAFLPPALSAEDDNQNSPDLPHFTLNNLYGMAIEEAESIRRAKEDVYIAQKDKKRALSVLIPRLTAFGTYTLSDYDQDTDPPFPGDPAQLDIDDNAMAWGLSLNQSFTLNGKELAALEMANVAIDKSVFDLTTVKEGFLFKVANAYYGVLRAKKGWQIAEESVKRLEKHKELVKARLELDAVTKTDLYRAESELSDALATLVQDKNQYLYSKAALRALINLPDDFIIDEPGETDAGKEIPDLDTLKDEGIVNRTEIKSAQKQQILAEKNVKISKGDYWPTVSLEAKYTNQSDDYGGTYDYDQDTSGYSIGATLSFTLFDGGLRNAEIAQANARERQTRFAVSETSRLIRLEIEDAYLQVMTQKGRLSSLNDKVSYSKQNFLAVSEQYKHGVANSVDMMDANTLLVSAEKGLSEAVFSYKLALLRLKRSTGSFLEDALKGQTHTPNQ